MSGSVRRHQPPQCLEPVLDDDDLLWARIIGSSNLCDHQEALAVRRHVVTPPSRRFGEFRLSCSVPPMGAALA